MQRYNSAKGSSNIQEQSPESIITVKSISVLLW